MKRMLVSGFLFGWLLLFPGSAQADSETRAFCSLASADGLWHLAYNGARLKAVCDRAQDGLEARTNSPIVNRQHGYYNRRNYKVTVRCSSAQGSPSYRGSKDAPFERATQWARSNHHRGCLYGVEDLDEVNAPRDPE